MGRNPSNIDRRDTRPGGSLAAFACPNPDCSHFNRFDAGNLSVVEWTGKHKHIRRLYCSACKHRFTERQGTSLRYCKLPEETVVRIVKCLGHGCSVEATADICEAIQLDELHGRVSPTPEEKGGAAGLRTVVAAWVGPGFTRRWRSSAGS